MKHSGPLPEHDAVKIAALLERGAAILRDGYRRTGPIRQANEWAGHLRAAGGGTRSGAGDPTGEAATNAHHWTTEVAHLIGAHARQAADATEALISSVARVHHHIDATDDDPTLGAALDRLDEANRRAGDCDCCGRTCTGNRDDRLTALAADWTTWRSGDERRHTEQRSVCAACRASWTRAKDRGDTFTSWERRRRRGLDSEDVA